MKWLARFFCSLLLVAPASALAEDEHVHFDTQITMIFTGFDAEQFGIHTLPPPIATPQCEPNVPGFATNIDHPGFHTIYAAALLAFAERATVNVIISTKGCVAGRPRLMGINILR